MKRFLGCCLAALWASGPLAHADATLVYQLDDASDGKVEKTLSVSRFFVRIDSSDEEGRYLLFQAGKFFPLYSVNEKEETYTRLTPQVVARLGPESRTKGAQAQPAAEEAKPIGAEDTRAAAEEAVPAGPVSESGRAASPDAPAAAAAQTTAAGGSPEPAPREGDDQDDGDDQAGADQTSEGEEEMAKKPASTTALAQEPRFEASTKMDEVAGIACRVVLEIVGDKPTVEHCMANKAALGITERETRTLARLFVLARKRGWDWLGAATKDEEFVSIRSRRVGEDGSLTLKSVSTQALPADHLRIPRSYKEIEPAQP
jgi:hypothetical protein